MPFFRGLRQRFSSGWAYSPELGGRSANPEFELLSGLATYFLPRESVPYMTFVSRPLPALPRFFSERNYHASALHVDTLGFFNYVEVYRDFGFSDARTLRSKPGVQLDAAGRVPSDESVVDFVTDVSHRCPVAIWSNMGAQKRDFEVSFNFLGQRILAEMGIEPTGVWRANAAMASRYPVLSKFVQTSDGQRFLPGDLPADDARQITEYGLVQYDILFGRQYSLRERPPS